MEEILAKTAFILLVLSFWFLFALCGGGILYGISYLFSLGWNYWTCVAVYAAISLLLVPLNLKR